MRSINLKWLNLTLRSDEPNSSSEKVLKTPKIKRLEIRKMENRQFCQKYRKFSIEQLNQPNEKNVVFWDCGHFHKNIRLWLKTTNFDFFFISAPNFIFFESPIFVKMPNLTGKHYFFKKGLIFHQNCSVHFWNYFLRNILPPPCGEKIKLHPPVMKSVLKWFIHFPDYPFFHFISPRSRSVPVIKRRSSRLASFSSFRDSKLYRIGFDSWFMSHKLWVTYNESY